MELTSLLGVIWLNVEVEVVVVAEETAESGRSAGMGDAKSWCQG